MLEKEASYIDPHKEFRPFLITELMYQGKPQLFGIPLSTNIYGYRDEFWEKLPARLETENTKNYGLRISSMIPVSLDALDKKHFAHKRIPSDETKREILVQNLMIKNPATFHEKAQGSFLFMKKMFMKKGLGVLDEPPFQAAYAMVAESIHRTILNSINSKIDKIILKAQNYLTNNYEVTLDNIKKHKVTEFVNMPKGFTQINNLLPLAQMYGEKGQTLSKIEGEKEFLPTKARCVIMEEKGNDEFAVAFTDGHQLPKIITVKGGDILCENGKAPSADGIVVGVSLAARQAEPRLFEFLKTDVPTIEVSGAAVAASKSTAAAAVVPGQGGATSREWLELEPRLNYGKEGDEYVIIKSDAQVKYKVPVIDVKTDKAGKISHLSRQAYDKIKPPLPLKQDTAKNILKR